MEEAVRITPEQFQTIYSIFIGIILLFFAYVGIQMLMMRHRINNPPPRRPRSPASSGGGRTGDSSGALHTTFGTSGIGAGDMTPAGGFASTSSDSSSDVAGASWDSSDMGGGDSGGGDFSGGGGDSGGGGSSGSWS